MGLKTIDDTYLDEIAGAIREKNGESTKYEIQEFKDAILNIKTKQEPIFKIPRNWIYGTPKSNTTLRLLCDYNRMYGVGGDYEISIATTARLNQSSNCQINWGDGTVERFHVSTDDSNVILKAHSYSEEGIYQIEISNLQFNKLLYSRFNSMSKIIAVDWCDSNFTSLEPVVGTEYTEPQPGVPSASFEWPIALIGVARTENATYTPSIQNCFTVILPSDEVIPNRLRRIKHSDVYVPDNLLSDYEVATNWCAPLNRIFPISECPYIEDE